MCLHALGIFGGYGATFPGGISMSDIENSLSGNSMGISLDVGACIIPAGYGGGFNFGYNEEGITSVGSSKGIVRLGHGCGFSITLDICTTEVQWCK